MLDNLLYNTGENVNLFLKTSERVQNQNQFIEIIFHRFQKSSGVFQIYWKYDFTSKVKINSELL